MVSCSLCATPHHQDCWEYNRGCSIYGCSAAATPDVMVIEAYSPAESPEPDPTVPLTVRARRWTAIAAGAGIGHMLGAPLSAIAVAVIAAGAGRSVVTGISSW